MRVLGIPGLPLALTLAGLVPLAASAGVVWTAAGEPILRAQVSLVLLAYSAVVLSFLGGVRWGAEINAQGGGIPRAALMSLSVLGPLAAWGILLWGVLGGLDWPVFAAAVLAHGAQLVWDADGAGLPTWFRRLRVFAGTFAVLALAAAGAAYALR